jgi:voltage-gated potassium channel
VTPSGPDAAGGRLPRLARWPARAKWPMVAVTLVSLPVIMVDESHLGAPWDGVARAANWLVWLAFAVELAIMLAVAPEKRRWLRHHPLELGIVVLTPPFLPPSLQAARVFRLLLAVRALAAAAVVRTLLSVAGLRYVSLLALVTVLGGGTAFAAVEQRQQQLSSWDGVWWAIVTVTTVGYGDITPKTTAGRVIAIFVMLGGIGFIAVLTAAIAQRFIAVGATGSEEDLPPDEHERQLERRLDRLEHRLAALAGSSGAVSSSSAADGSLLERDPATLSSGSPSSR